jgi:hypothetical protein
MTPARQGLHNIRRSADFTRDLVALCPPCHAQTELALRPNLFVRDARTQFADRHPKPRHKARQDPRRYEHRYEGALAYADHHPGRLREQDVGVPFTQRFVSRPALSRKMMSGVTAQPATSSATATNAPAATRSARVIR